MEHEDAGARVHLLGRVGVTVDGAPRAVAGPKERSVIALLALNPNQAVPDATLIEALWNDPPASAKTVVRNLVLRVRKSIGADLVQRSHGGYALHIPEDAVDAVHAAALFRRGREDSDRGNHKLAAAGLRTALDLWDGEPLTGATDTPILATEVARLCELRLAVNEAWVHSQLALGHHDAVIPELEALTAQNPLRERIWGQQMLALHRAGRQGDALAAFQKLRRNVVTELGLDPSAELVTLNRAIAAGTADPAPGARDLPHGIVSFLLTDVEGSTRLLSTLGAQYASDLGAALSLIRTAAAAHGGVEVNTTGDGMLVAFGDAHAAALSAIEAQRRLLAPGALESGLKMRMGIHTGPATPTETGDYVSLAVNHAARVCDTAHGGQIVVSAATADAARSRLGDVNELTPLGSYLLREIPEPMQLLQLRAPDLPRAFPALRAPHTNARLLADRSTFVGRGSDLDTLAELLAAYALVTVVGPGGVGKTRLVREHLRRAGGSAPDGVWFVSLASIVEPEAVHATVAGTLGITGTHGVDVLDALIDRLARSRAILVFDNCEHVIDSIADLATTLLSSCPDLRILATSREPLNLAWEAVHALAPLAVPEVGATANEAGGLDAVRLFEDRARQASAAFAVTDDKIADVIEICRLLDGLPLAIELVAPLVRRMSLAELSARVGSETLPTMTGRGRERRHLTLHDAIDWSYRLLDHDERTVLCSLSAFAGRFTEDAATAVVAASPVPPSHALDTVASLAEKSLVALDHSAGSTRYFLLSAIRTYARGELAQMAHSEATYRAHLDWYVEVAENAEVETVGEMLAPDHDDLRSALTYAARLDDQDTLVRLTLALRSFWQIHGDFKEARRWIAAARARAVDPVHQVDLLLADGDFAFISGAYGEAEPLLKQALEQYRAREDPTGLGRTLHSLGRLAGYRGDNENGRADLLDALTFFRSSGDRRGAAMVLRDLGRLARHQGDYMAAQTHLVEALGTSRREGDRRGAADALSDLGRVATRRGHFDEARKHLQEALDLYAALGDRLNVAAVWYGLGTAEWRGGDSAAAVELLRSAVRRFREIDHPQGAAWPLANLGRIALEAGNARGARAAYDEVLGIGRVLANKPITMTALMGLADVTATAGEHREATTYLIEARDLAVAIGYEPEIAEIDRRLEELRIT